MDEGIMAFRKEILDGGGTVVTNDGFLLKKDCKPVKLDMCLQCGEWGGDEIPCDCEGDLSSESEWEPPVNDHE